ncbi:hypothetical protein PM082_006508 [Marasmius tenuissimus]|nr:hypothetical protein PM082_006508 [Marasmius tenuissimus]
MKSRYVGSRLPFDMAAALAQSLEAALDPCQTLRLLSYIGRERTEIGLSRDRLKDSWLLDMVELDLWSGATVLGLLGYVKKVVGSSESCFICFFLRSHQNPITIRVVKMAAATETPATSPVETPLSSVLLCGSLVAVAPFGATLDTGGISDAALDAALDAGGTSTLALDTGEASAAELIGVYSI